MCQQSQGHTVRDKYMSCNSTAIQAGREGVCWCSCSCCCRGRGADSARLPSLCLVLGKGTRWQCLCPRVTSNSDPGSGVAQSGSMSQDSRAEDWETAEDDVMKHRVEK